MNCSSKTKTKKLIYFLGIALALLFLSAAVFLYTAVAPVRYEATVRRNAAKFRLESELVFAVIRAESNFRADARSSAGAVGLMQLMPATAEFIARSAGGEYDLNDTEDNVCMGCWYLAYLGERFCSLTEILAAYNAGEGIVRGWLQNEAYCDGAGSLTVIPYPETRRYVQRVKNFYNCYKLLYF